MGPGDPLADIFCLAISPTLRQLDNVIETAGVKIGLPPMQEHIAAALHLTPDDASANMTQSLYCDGDAIIANLDATRVLEDEMLLLPLIVSDHMLSIGLELNFKKTKILKLVQCERCDAVCDKYLEYEGTLLLLDVGLQNKSALRHLLINADHSAAILKVSLLTLIIDAYCRYVIQIFNPFGI